MKKSLESVTFPIRGLRQPMALNFFKSHLLGTRHIPMKAQTEDVLTALSEIGMDDSFDPRTWRGWFAEDARRARGDSISELDKVAMRLPSAQPGGGMIAIQPTSSFFLEMTEGGLCKELLEPTASKKPKYPLLQKADDYVPCSQWHFHLDAIEAAALAESNGEVDWETVKAIAAGRVLSILHSRWNPRDGSIYQSLSSDLLIQWNHANQLEREKIQNGFAQFTPNLFSRFMKLPPCPNWSRIHVEVDIGATQVHKLLFAMAADEEFLIADRLDAWALDMATAALAMFARALTNRYATFGVSIGPEFLYWDAFEMLFFRDEENETVVFDALHRAMECSGAPLSIRSFELLVTAGARYKSALEKLGVNREYVADLTSRCWAMHPMVYRGGGPDRE